MRIAVINSNRRNKIYPVGVYKIASYLKKEGNDVVVLNNKLPKNNVDEIWISTVFTFDFKYVVSIIKVALNKCDKVRIGGVSATLLEKEYKKLNYDIDVHIGLLSEAENITIDPTLFNEKPDYTVVWTSRGCVRDCPFCMVKKLEPKFKPIDDWQKTLLPFANKIVFLDNNWLASPNDKIKKDIKIMKKLVKNKRIKKIDFNQGLDARLMNKNIANSLQGLPITPIRFAFDGMHEDGYFQKAVKLMYKRGFKKFRTLMLYGFDDKPEHLWIRLRKSLDLRLETGADIETFPMPYQSILKIGKNRDTSGVGWNKREFYAAKKLITTFFPFGTVIPRSLKEFEYCFTSSAEKFKKLLNYSKIKLYVKRKKAHLRNNRKKILYD